MTTLPAPNDRFGLVGALLENKYAVERPVAEGGFGVVYRARHATLNTPVAVKVLVVPKHFEGELLAKFLEKFRLEAQTIASLQHPSIVRVLDFGTSVMPSGVEAPWMVLEWLDGQSLESQIEARYGRGGRSPREVLDLLRPALEAVAVAHDAGVAHRDLKPANMLLVKARRGEPSLRLLDFGIAKVMDPDAQASGGKTATQNELTAFSPLYAAPEQVTRTRTGPWTDVHALALMVVEMLTDTSPYGTDDMHQLYVQVLSKDRPTPGRIGVDVGPWEAVLARALAVVPSARQVNAGALLGELEASAEAADRAWYASRPTHGTPAAKLGAAAVAVTVAAPPPPSSPHVDTFMGAQTQSPRGGPSSRRRAGALLLAGALALAFSVVAVVRSRGAPVAPSTARGALTVTLDVPHPTDRPAPSPRAPVTHPEAPAPEVPPSSPPRAPSRAVRNSSPRPARGARHARADAGAEQPQNATAPSRVVME